MLSEWLFFLSVRGGFAVPGGDRTVYHMDYPVGVSVSPPHRTGIKEQDPSGGTGRIGGIFACRNMGVSEEDHVCLYLRCPVKYAVHAHFDPAGVTVETEKSFSSEIQHTFLSAVCAACGEREAGITVAAQNTAGEMWIIGEYIPCFSGAVAEKDDSFRVPMCIQRGAERMG